MCYRCGEPDYEGVLASDGRWHDECDLRRTDQQLHARRVGA